jgi:hypothetical protein
VNGQWVEEIGNLELGGGVDAKNSVVGGRLSVIQKLLNEESQVYNHCFLYPGALRLFDECRGTGAG